MTYIDIPDTLRIYKQLEFQLYKPISFSDFNFYLSYSYDKLSDIKQFYHLNNDNSNSNINININNYDSLLYDILNEKQVAYNSSMLKIFNYIDNQYKKFYMLDTLTYQFPCVFSLITDETDIKDTFKHFKIIYDKASLKKITIQFKKYNVLMFFINCKVICLIDKKICDKNLLKNIITTYLDKLIELNDTENNKIKDIIELNLSKEKLIELLSISNMYNIFYTFSNILIQMYVSNYYDIHPTIFLNNLVTELQSDISTLLKSDYFNSYKKYNSNNCTIFFLISICKMLNLNILVNTGIYMLTQQFTHNFNIYKHEYNYDK